MVTATKQNKAQGNGDKPKTPAVKLDITQLVVLSAYERTFSTGSRGFYGTALNPANGKRYQVIGAVEIGSKAR